MYNYRFPLFDEEFCKLHECYESNHIPPPRPVDHPRSGYSPYCRPSTSTRVEKRPCRTQASIYSEKHNDMFYTHESKPCAVKVKLPFESQVHSSGKPHVSKLKQFFTEWSLNTGNPTPQFDQYTPTSTLISDYCKLCDVRLSSTWDKILHRSGVTRKDNEEGSVNIRTNGNSCGIMNLSQADAQTNAYVLSESKAISISNGVKVTGYACDLCDVKVPYLEELNIHFNGKKHRKRLREEQERLLRPDKMYKCDICNVSFKTRPLFNLHLKSDEHEDKLDSVFIEKSCELCKVVYHTYNQYLDHTSGKRHKMNILKIAYQNAGFSNDQMETPDR